MKSWDMAWMSNGEWKSWSPRKRLGKGPGTKGRGRGSEDVL